MIPYNRISLLDTATQNHTDYLIQNNVFSHYEVSGNPGFTGVNPWDRGTYVSYSWTAYGENLSAGDADVYESIDSLFTAIYHRFGFLNFNKDDIGFGISRSESYAYKSAYGYDMGNTGDTSTTQLQNPAYVLWPYSGYGAAQTSFFNTESPAPTPECVMYGASGNPVSINFNPSKTGSVAMTSFTLTDGSGHNVDIIKVLTPSSYEFALFPSVPLHLATNYTATFIYSEDGAPKQAVWHFTTRTPSYKRYEVYPGGTYDVKSNETYLLQIRPDDCTVPLDSFSGGGAPIDYSRPSMDQLVVTPLSGIIGAETHFDYGSGMTFTLRVSQTDSAITPADENTKKVLPAILNLILN